MELNRNSLKESFISKNSEPTENSFQITLTQEQIIKKEITVELNTNSPTNNSVFSEPGTVRPLIVKSYTSDQKNSETLVFPLIHLLKPEKLKPISLAFIAEIKNYNPKKWLFIGFTLGILALIVIIIQPENNVSDTI